MGATKLFILENSLGQKVRTFAIHSDTFNLVYRPDNRRMEAVLNLKDLDSEKIDYRLIKFIDVKDVTTEGIELKGLGRVRTFKGIDSHNSPRYELPLEEDEEQLKVILKKTTVVHMAAIFLLLISAWIWTSFIVEKKEQPLVTIVLPKAETPKQEKVVKKVKVSEKKIKPSKKVYKPKTQVAKRKMKTKAYTTRKAKAVDVQQVGALAALGGLPNGSKGYEGLDRKSMKNIRSAGYGSGGGGIGSTGRGGVKGFIPGTGLVAGSAGSGGKASSAGGYGTRGSGGGKAGYGKITIVGGTSAVSLPLDDEATIEGGLDRDQIIAVINKNRGQIVYCYERGLQQQPHIGGRVAVSFVIGPNGRVSTAGVAQSTLASRMVENCIVSRMKTWQFPRPVGKVSVDVLYPFELMRVSSR